MNSRCTTPPTLLYVCAWWLCCYLTVYLLTLLAAAAPIATKWTVNQQHGGGNGFISKANLVKLTEVVSTMTTGELAKGLMGDGPSEGPLAGTRKQGEGNTACDAGS